ncbi:hypothetical protein GCHA_3539 [Paraglaciecola chathamensis S18K6]|uniref:Uncharacterized protein n=1 Tax=Paraglaciecola chathamensis S18K6 TaxID=1127672 RepID=A0AAV3UXS8_9ALTE|nr:hypothetical protein GCHA_3539 [Paraglaciecola chathamensis S18K6]
MPAKKREKSADKLTLLSLLKTDCPRCLRMRYIILWGILMGLMYFCFWV